MSVMHKVQGQDRCAEHGLYTYSALQVGKSIVGKSCPQCLLRSQLQSVIDNEQIELTQKQIDWTKRLTRAGVPPAFLSTTLDNYMPTTSLADSMLNNVKAYTRHFNDVLAEKPVSGIVFTGVPGTGKTHIACGMISQLLANGHSGAYMACPHFLLEAKEAQFSRTNERTSRVIERYVDPEFVVMDEFGTHTLKDIDYQLLFTVLDGRYQRNLPTLLVTNLTIGELSKTVDPRFMERVRGARGPSYSFDWPTHRRPNAGVRV